MRFFQMSGALAFVLCLFGSAAIAQVESTPVPNSAKPDFSASQFLLGTWNCSVLSSRRPGPYQVTSVATLDSNGYWMTTKSTVHKASWIPASFQGVDRVTYDASTSRWIDLSTSDNGGYNVSTSLGWKGNSIVWTDLAFPKSNNIASTSPTTMTKVSATKTMSANSFKEHGGRLVTVKTTCTKA